MEKLFISTFVGHFSVAKPQILTAALKCVQSDVTELTRFSFWRTDQ